MNLPGVPGVFDLSPLQGTTWAVNSTDNAYRFEFSVCGAVPQCAGHTNASVCQLWHNGEASCGVWNPAQIEPIPIPSPGAFGVGLSVKNGDEVSISPI